MKETDLHLLKEAHSKRGFVTVGPMSEKRIPNVCIIVSSFKVFTFYTDLYPTCLGFMSWI